MEIQKWLSENRIDSDSKQYIKENTMKFRILMAGSDFEHSLA